MTINDQIKDEKLQHDINREAAKISALSSSKTHKYEYLVVENILPVNHQQIIEQARFTYSPLGKAFEKQINTIKDQGEKPVKALKSIKKLSAGDAIPNRAFTIDEAREELNKIKEIEKNVDREKLFYKSNKDTNHFKDFRAIRTFREDIYEGKTTFDEADEYQSDLADRINDFIKKTNPHTEEKKCEKKSTKKNLIIIIIQCNNSESLLNEIRQIIYSLYQSKDITEKVYNNLLTSL